MVARSSFSCREKEQNKKALAKFLRKYLPLQWAPRKQTQTFVLTNIGNLPLDAATQKTVLLLWKNFSNGLQKISQHRN